jgi:FixJ family two-component response regulator
MNGLELLVQLGNRDVSLPAILIATHPSAALRHKVATNGHHLIEKPLLGDTLIRCIRDIFTD